jgi:serine/threonine-protein kinase
MTKIGVYKIIKQIGEGGFARTYLGEHDKLKEYACLKQNINMEPEDVELLLKEAKLLWHIHHYALPTLRDFIQCPDDSFVLVMTYVEGKDLYKIVEKDYPRGIHPEHVCWMMQRMLNAMHYLHYNNIIHGDIKPQNIIIKPKEHLAVLVDYGLSTLRPGRMTRCPGYTPAFAAPEQLAGKPPIPETDIFGLGVSMIYALGGNFAAKTLPDSVPKKLKDFILKMVVHDPLARPKNAAELNKTLSDLREEVFGRRSSKQELKVS